MFLDDAAALMPLPDLSPDRPAAVAPQHPGGGTPTADAPPPIQVDATGPVVRTSYQPPGAPNVPAADDREVARTLIPPVPAQFPESPPPQPPSQPLPEPPQLPGDVPPITVPPPVRPRRPQPPPVEAAPPINPATPIHHAVPPADSPPPVDRTSSVYPSPQVPGKSPSSGSSAGWFKGFVNGREQPVYGTFRPDTGVIDYRPEDNRHLAAATYQVMPQGVSTPYATSYTTSYEVMQPAGSGLFGVRSRRLFGRPLFRGRLFGASAAACAGGACAL